MACSRSRSS